MIKRHTFELRLPHSLGTPRSTMDAARIALRSYGGGCRADHPWFGLTNAMIGVTFPHTVLVGGKRSVGVSRSQAACVAAESCERFVLYHNPDAGKPLMLAFEPENEAHFMRLLLGSLE